MNNFRQFLENEEKDNIKKMLSKLPLRHQKLMHGFKFKLQSGNTLKGDNDHIGVIHKDKITVAAPWVYSREYTFLHEISHQIFEHLMTAELRKEWADLVKKTMKKQKEMVKSKGESTDALDQGAEEIFAMAYACFYSKHKMLIYHNPEWMNFIKNKVPS